MKMKISHGNRYHTAHDFDEERRIASDEYNKTCNVIYGKYREMLTQYSDTDKNKYKEMYKDLLLSTELEYRTKLAQINENEKEVFNKDLMDLYDSESDFNYGEENELEVNEDFICDLNGEYDCSG